MRDYANKNRRSSSSGRNGLRWVSIVLIILALSLPFLLTYMHYKTAPTKKELSHNKDQPKKMAVLKPKDPSQEFDFYTLLPKMAVPDNAPVEKKSV